PSWLSGYALRAHAHLMLVGFVGMMIFGVGLHVLPRFVGRALFSERLADAQFALANAGLVAMVAGWLASVESIVGAGGAALWLALVLFAVNSVLTVRPWGRRGRIAPARPAPVAARTDSGENRAMAEYCGCELPEGLWYDLD